MHQDFATKIYVRNLNKFDASIINVNIPPVIKWDYWKNGANGEDGVEIIFPTQRYHR